MHSEKTTRRQDIFAHKSDTEMNAPLADVHAQMFDNI